MSQVRVVEDDLSWDRVKAKITKPIFIISSVIAVLILAVVIAVVVIFAGGNNSNDLAIDYSRALVVSDEKNLWALDLNSRKKTLLVSSNHGIATFDVHEKQTIYYREIDSQWVNSLSKKYQNLTQSRQWDPTAVRVDSITENVYILDGFAGKLNVYNSKAHGFGVACSDLIRPVDMVLDSQRGIMFIVQKFHSILKGSMNGTLLRKIIISNSVIAVATDIQSPRLYWSEYESIESSDYDGDKRLTMTRSKSTIFWNIGVSGRRLFWTKSVNDGSRSLWSCIPGSANVCTNDEIRQLDFKDPKGIEVFTGETSVIMDNPCEKANCQGLCLLNSELGYSCACPLGQQLAEDERTCKNIDEYLLYVRGDFVRGRIIGGDSRGAFADAILPIRLRWTSLKEKKTIDFDFDYRQQKIIFSDDVTVNTVNLEREELQGTYNRDSCLKKLAYDWTSNDVYYTKDTCKGDDEHTTIVLFKPKEEAFISKTLHKFNAVTGNLRSIALEPNNGYYFFTITLDNVTMIHKVYTKVTLLVRDDVSDVDLAIDYELQRIYWFSRDRKRLLSADFVGERIESIDVSRVKNPRSVSVYKQYVYVANFSSIWRFDKTTGMNVVKLTLDLNDDDDHGMIAGVRMFARQRIDHNNPCAFGNGGCRQFCFLEPKKIVHQGSINVTDELQKSCLCEDYKLLQADGISCA